MLQVSFVYTFDFFVFLFVLIKCKRTEASDIKRKMYLCFALLLPYIFISYIFIQNKLCRLIVLIIKLSR